MSTLEGGAWQAAGGYLEHLSDADLALLGSAAGSLPAGRLRADPAVVERLLDDQRTFETVFGAPGRADPLLRASPFLVFAVAIQRGAEDLREAAFVGEWAGPRRRLPVFDAGSLRDFLAAPARRHLPPPRGPGAVPDRGVPGPHRHAGVRARRRAAAAAARRPGRRRGGAGGVDGRAHVGVGRRRAAGAARPPLVPARLPERAGAHGAAAGDGRGGRALRPGEADPQHGHRHLPLPLPRPLVPRPLPRRLNASWES